MLARVLEEEVMDTSLEAEDYNSMDHSQVNRLFVRDFLAAGAVESKGDLEAGNAMAEILDLGTGTALIPLEYCRTHASGRIVAFDLSGEMLRVAERNVRQAGLENRIVLQRIDAKQLPFASGRFGAVMSNSIVHHIPEPRHVLSEAVRVTRPGGLLFFRDLLRPDSLQTLQQLVDSYAAGANEHQRAMFAASLHAALSLDEIQSLVAELGFAKASVTATSDRHWTWSARTPR